MNYSINLDVIVCSICILEKSERFKSKSYFIITPWPIHSNYHFSLLEGVVTNLETNAIRYGIYIDVYLPRHNSFHSLKGANTRP